MQKLFKLLEKHELAQHLMNDKEFVEGAKKILKEGNIEVDENKLGELMKKIEEELCKSKELKDEQLANVSGGSKKAKATAVKVISTTAGTLIGGVLIGGVTGGFGAVSMAFTGAAIDSRFSSKDRSGMCGFFAGGITGGVVGLAGGTAAGGYLGNKLGVTGSAKKLDWNKSHKIKKAI